MSWRPEHKESKRYGLDGRCEEEFGGVATKGNGKAVDALAGNAGVDVAVGLVRGDKDGVGVVEAEDR